MNLIKNRLVLPFEKMIFMFSLQQNQTNCRVFSATKPNNLASYTHHLVMHIYHSCLLYLPSDYTSIESPVRVFIRFRHESCKLFSTPAACRNSINLSPSCRTVITHLFRRNPTRFLHLSSQTHSMNPKPQIDFSLIGFRFWFVVF